jgi:hypothetical protein
MPSDALVSDLTALDNSSWSIMVAHYTLESFIVGVVV